MLSFLLPPLLKRGGGLSEGGTGEGEGGVLGGRSQVGDEILLGKGVFGGYKGLCILFILFQIIFIF